MTRLFSPVVFWYTCPINDRKKIIYHFKKVVENHFNCPYTIYMLKSTSIILSPSYRNEENSYRYYSAEDIKKAEFITWLRKFNFSIMEMKDVLSNMKTQEDFNDFIMEKISLVENAIKEQQNLITEMKTYLTLSPLENKEVKDMCYKVNLTELDSQLVATIRFKGKYCEIGDYFSKLFEYAGEKVTGVPFTCYNFVAKTHRLAYGMKATFLLDINIDYMYILSYKGE